MQNVRHQHARRWGFPESGQGLLKQGLSLFNLSVPYFANQPAQLEQSLSLERADRLQHPADRKGSVEVHNRLLPIFLPARDPSEEMKASGHFDPSGSPLF